MITFRIVESLARIFPDPSGPLANFAEELFEILGSYFPIHFTHVRHLNASFFYCVLFAFLFVLYACIWMNFSTLCGLQETKFSTISFVN